MSIWAGGLAWGFQLKLCLGLPGPLALFESHPLSGPQFPLVYNAGVGLDLLASVRASQKCAGKSVEYTDRAGVDKKMSFQSGEEFQGEDLGEQARPGEERGQSGDAGMHRSVGRILRPAAWM